MLLRLELHTLLVMLAATGVTTAAPPSFFDKATKEWARYLKELESFQATVEERYYDSLNEDKVLGWSYYELKQRHGARLFAQETGEKEKPEGYCWVLNNRYAFVLKKDAGRPGNQWTLSEIETEVDKGIKNAYIRSQLQEQGVAVNYAPIGTGHGFVSNILKDPGMAILQEEKVQVTGVEHIKITFKMSHKEEDKKRPGPQLIDGDGWIVFCPNQYWRVCEYKLPLIHKSGDCDCYGVLECNMVAGAFPVLKRMENTYFKGADKKQKYMTRVAEYKIESGSSEADFLLGAFGFPEPKILKPLAWWSHPHIWFSIAALTCFALVLVIRRYKPQGRQT